MDDLILLKIAAWGVSVAIVWVGAFFVMLGFLYLFWELSRLTHETPYRWTWRRRAEQAVFNIIAAGTVATLGMCCPAMRLLARVVE